jgi:23S rRNA-/tRNA-specific pseudouridylate synthase
VRLDQAIPQRFPELSRRKARELISQRRILVNDRPVGVASREVSERDRIAIVEDFPEIEILREEPDWIAVNKPAGLATQPMRERSQRSLEELMRVKYRDVYVVHRIDTQTSGVILFGRTREAAARLSALFAAREIRKTYLAVVEGMIDHEQTIESPIGGKDAHTVVRPLRVLGDTTLVAAEIQTGRMHQIRIHLKSIERPVAGDRRYGSSMHAPRMLLHAWKLEHASLGTLTAPPPPDFPPL